MGERQPHPVVCACCGGINRCVRACFCANCVAFVGAGSPTGEEKP